MSESKHFRALLLSARDFPTWSTPAGPRRQRNVRIASTSEFTKHNLWRSSVTCVFTGFTESADAEEVSIG